MKALAEAVDATIKGINEAPVLRAGRTTTQSFPTGSTPNPIGFTTIYEDPLAMANAGGTAFTIKKAGIWTISAAAGFVFNATGPRFLTIMNGANTVASTSTMAISTSPWTTALNISLTFRISLNNVISINVQHAAGVSLDLSLAGFNPSVNMVWLRP